MPTDNHQETGAKPDSAKTQSQPGSDQSQQNQNEKKPELGADGKPIASQPNNRDGSIYKDLGVDEPGGKGASTMPDNWREILATGADGKVDQDELKRLQRYQSPQAYNKSSAEAARRLRSGEFKRGKPEGDNPEQLKAWRAENGIPEDFNGYEIPLPGGQQFDQLDDSTKENINGFRKAFHDAELQGPQAQKITKAIIEIAEKDMAATAQKDAVAQEGLEDGLRAEWGPDYRTNLQVAEAHGLKVFGDDFYAIVKSRLPDGRRLGDLPGFHKYLAAQGRLDGSDEHIGGDSDGKGGTLEGRREEIRKIMATDISRYQNDPAMVKEYQGILEKLDAKGKLDPKTR